MTMQDLHTSLDQCSMVFCTAAQYEWPFSLFEGCIKAAFTQRGLVRLQIQQRFPISREGWI